MFLGNAKTLASSLAIAGMLWAAGYRGAFCADPASSTNSSTELQSGQRFDLQKITGSQLPQTNSADTNSTPAVQTIATPVIQAPLANETVKGDVVEVKLGVLYPGSGERIYHVIVNNDPPIVVKDETKPLVLRDLNAGGNLLRVFMVSADGKVGPMPQSFAMTYFYFRKHDFSNIVRRNQPFLSVNLPLDGPTVADEQGRVAFDYIVHNAQIGEKGGVRLKYTLNQREETVDKPGPIYWKDLSPGKYSLKAELVDEQGAPILGTYCKVERSFEMARIMKPLQLEKEDSVLRDIINRTQTNQPATSTNPPANYTTTNSPVKPPVPSPTEKKNKTLKPR